MPVELGNDLYIMGHAASRFVKHEKYQDIKRKARIGAIPTFNVCMDMQRS